MLRLYLTEDQTKGLRKKVNTSGQSFLSHCFHLSCFTRLPTTVPAVRETWNRETVVCILPAAEIAFSICALSEVLPNCLQNHRRMSFLWVWVWSYSGECETLRPRGTVNYGKTETCFSFFLSRHCASECRFWMYLFSHVSVSSTKHGSIFPMMVSVWWQRHVINQPVTQVTVQWGPWDPSPEHQDIRERAFPCLLMSEKEPLLSE